MARLFAVLLLALTVSVLSGSSRFLGAAPAGALWLDVLFLLSAGIALSMGVLIVGRWMRHDADRGTDGEPGRRDCPNGAS